MKALETHELEQVVGGVSTVELIDFLDRFMRESVQWYREPFPITSVDQ
jgi:hypothetical protein